MYKKHEIGVLDLNPQAKIKVCLHAPFEGRRCDLRLHLRISPNDKFEATPLCLSFMVNKIDCLIALLEKAKIQAIKEGMLREA